MEAWNRWDAPHYLSVAQNGYQITGDAANFIVFYPLFPFLIYLVSLFLGNIFLSSIVVSNLFYILSIVYFYKLVALDFDKKTAWRAVVLISIFPTAYFFHASYTESLFLFLSVASFYLARRNNWFCVSVLAMFACLSRVSGIVLPIALLVEFFSKRTKTKNFYNLLYFLLIALGPLIYLLINYILFRDPLYFLTVQKTHWFHSLASPIYNFSETLRAISWRNLNDSIIYSWMQIAFIAFTFILSIVAFFKVRLSYAVYAVSSIVFIALPTFWISIPRYVIITFPIFIVLALLSKNKILFTILSVLFLILFFPFFFLYLQGLWAFWSTFGWFGFIELVYFILRTWDRWKTFFWCHPEVCPKNLIRLESRFFSRKTSFRMTTAVVFSTVSLLFLKKFSQ